MRGIGEIEQGRKMRLSAVANAELYAVRQHKTVATQVERGRHRLRRSVPDRAAIA
jgi:hypothetical protein